MKLPWRGNGHVPVRIRATASSSPKTRHHASGRAARPIVNTRLREVPAFGADRALKAAPITSAAMSARESNGQNHLTRSGRPKRPTKNRRLYGSISIKGFTLLDVTDLVQEDKSTARSN